ncbi:MAG: hypothetical protein L3J82_04110 [Planctomycetes bacterium]|nr:hypothetical protein [Planctomycetota bacterium]
MQKLFKYLGTICIAIVFIGIVSLATSFESWRVEFPPAVIDLKIVSEDGTPIPNSRVGVLLKGGREPNVPFGDKVANNSLFTDEDGVVRLYQPRSGTIYFHGNSAKLFWAWQIGHSKVEYMITVGSDGYFMNYVSPKDIYDDGKYHPNETFQLAEIDYKLRGRQLDKESVSLPLITYTYVLTDRKPDQ